MNKKIVVCEFCHCEHQVDFEKLDFETQVSLDYWFSKKGKAWMPCDLCKKALEFQDKTQCRTDKCFLCNKLACYTPGEKFIRCFSCEQKQVVQVEN